MKTRAIFPSILLLILVLTGCSAAPTASTSTAAQPAATTAAAVDPLPSWNDGPAKQAIR